MSDDILLRGTICHCVSNHKINRSFSSISMWVPYVCLQHHGNELYLHLWGTPILEEPLLYFQSICRTWHPDGLFDLLLSRCVTFGIRKYDYKFTLESFFIGCRKYRRRVIKESDRLIGVNRDILLLLLLRWFQLKNILQDAKIGTPTQKWEVGKK